MYKHYHHPGGTSPKARSPEEKSYRYSSIIQKTQATGSRRGKEVADTAAHLDTADVLAQGSAPLPATVLGLADRLLSSLPGTEGEPRKCSMNKCSGGDVEGQGKTGRDLRA